MSEIGLFWTFDSTSSLTRRIELHNILNYSSGSLVDLLHFRFFGCFWRYYHIFGHISEKLVISILGPNPINLWKLSFST